MSHNRLSQWVVIGIILVSGCASQESYHLSPAFPTDIPNGCERICWFGIQLGVTTREQALERILTQEWVDQSSLEQSTESIKVSWFTEASREFQSQTQLSIKDGLVDSIQISNLMPFTTDDFIKLLGEPNEISITPWQGVHGEKFTNYVLHYSSRDLLVYVAGGDGRGPNPADHIDMLGTGLVLEGEADRQPWQGYEPGAYSLPMTP